MLIAASPQSARTNAMTTTLPPEEQPCEPAVEQRVTLRRHLRAAPIAAVALTLGAALPSTAAAAVPRLELRVAKPIRDEPKVPGAMTVGGRTYRIGIEHRGQSSQAFRRFGRAGCSRTCSGASIATRATCADPRTATSPAGGHSTHPCSATSPFTGRIAQRSPR